MQLAAADDRNVASLRACFAHSDLEWRLAQIPSTAMCRGAFFNMLDERAASLSSSTRAEYRRFFRVIRFVPFRMYPVTDYLTRMAIISQVTWGAEKVYEGLRTIQAHAFDAWAQTLLGRAALAVIDPSLGSVLRMIERAYASRTLNTHADFEVVHIDEETVVARFTDEYLPIEHAMVGALEAVLNLCKLDGSVRAELDSPFRGTVHVRLTS